jgi:hypothetical protein
MTATAQPLPGQCHRQVVEVRAEAVARVRHDVGAYVRLWGFGELADAAALCASELLSNVGKHTDCTMCVLTLERRSRGVRVTVSDSSEKLPVVQAPDWAAEGGRGLLVVEGVADTWGAEPTGDGKDVWVELRAPDERRRACGERTRLPPHLLDAALYFAAGRAADIERELRCTLEAHGSGDHHALVLDLPDPAGALWAPWVRGHAPSAVLVLPDCLDVCPSAGTPCCEFAAHPGAHTWQLEP